MNKRNYQNELDAVIADVVGKEPAPRLLLHSCCAPCSSYVLEYLAEYFAITVLYYNPNIFPPEEYDKRVEEQRRLIGGLTAKNPVTLWAKDYEPDVFYELVKGLETLPEGGERCFICYELRLAEAAGEAAQGGFDFFTTTLSISPHKNAQRLNEIGERLAQEYGVRHLPADFKKRGGYQRSVELSGEHGLYRQDYCGCVYSMKERDRREKDRSSS